MNLSPIEFLNALRSGKTEKELNKVLELTANPKHKLAFALGFYECMRVSEVAKLMPEHVRKDVKGTVCEDCALYKQRIPADSKRAP